MASFVTDPYWGENEGEGEELPGGGWQLPTGVAFKWVAVHLGKPYYVQRVVYMLAKRYLISNFPEKNNEIEQMIDVF